MGAFGRFCVRWGAILILVTTAACSQATATVAPEATVASATSLTAKENGGSFTYPVAGRFAVFLDKDSHPDDQFVCTPDNIVNVVKGTTGLFDPNTGLYGVGFEAEQVGTCTLTNGDFSVTITIVE